MTLTRITSLGGEAILPLADAKASAHITHDSEDAVLTGFRDAALAEIERKTGVALEEAQFLWAMPRFSSAIALPMRPAVSVDSVVYNDVSGAEQTYDDARLVNGAAYPAANGSWPAAYDYVGVTFTAGPPPLDQLAIMVVAAQLQFQIFENRGRDDQKYIEGIETAVRSVLGTIQQVLV